MCVILLYFYSLAKYISYIYLKEKFSLIRKLKNLKKEAIDLRKLTKENHIRLVDKILLF